MQLHQPRLNVGCGRDVKNLDENKSFIEEQEADVAERERTCRRLRDAVFGSEHDPYDFCTYIQNLEKLYSEVNMILMISGRTYKT